MEARAPLRNQERNIRTDEAIKRFHIVVCVKEMVRSGEVV